MQICSHLLNKFLTKKFIFCALICASKWTENYREEENNLFFEKLLLYSHFSKNSKICKFFTAWCLDVTPFLFCLFEVQSTLLVSSSQGENVVN